MDLSSLSASLPETDEKESDNWDHLEHPPKFEVPPNEDRGDWLDLLTIVIDLVYRTSGDRQQHLWDEARIFMWNRHKTHRFKMSVENYKNLVQRLEKDKCPIYRRVMAHNYLQVQSGNILTQPNMDLIIDRIILDFENFVYGRDNNWDLLF